MDRLTYTYVVITEQQNVPLQRRIATFSVRKGVKSNSTASHERFQYVHIVQYENNVTAEYPVFARAACVSQDVPWTLLM